MTTNRLEAFSDGVLAIVITIMVLEIEVPHDSDHQVLLPLVLILLSYVLSFIYIGIYWKNHHHLLHSLSRVNGSILWATLYLLFWLSLTPFATGCMGQNHFAPAPTAFYGVILLLAAVGHFLLQGRIIAAQGTASPLLCGVGIVSTLWSSAIAQMNYALVALILLMPDRRIERVLGEE